MREVTPATCPEDLAAVKALFEEYIRSLPFDLSYQQIGFELSTLPGKYAPPDGALLLARWNGAPAGCIGLRPHGDSSAELKRLYVSPDYRHKGIGRALIETGISIAQKIGYEELLLDTHKSMTDAIALYESFGFQPAAPYWANPVPDSCFYRLLID